MWELIQANKRNSVILMAAMAGCLIALGFIIGASIEPSRGGLIGAFIALILWIIQAAVSYWGGDRILLEASGAKKISHAAAPQLFNVVEEMKIAANLPKMPDVYIIPDEAANAFATGRNPESASIAVTAGLLSRLNRNELQGVIAHEMSHILNRDILFVMLAGVMLGTIVMLSDIFLRILRHSPAPRYSSRGSGKNGGQAILLLIAVVAAILAPIFARLLYFAISKKREYLADATGVRLSRYPEGLASALEKLTSSPRILTTANKVNAPMFIVNPFRETTTALDWFSTHPPIEERIRILRNMTHGVAFKDYALSYAEITGKRPAMPSSGLNDTAVQIRTPEQHYEVPQERSQKRQMYDVIAAVQNYAILTCDCGLKIKVPPKSQITRIQCPRCSRWLAVH